MQKVILHFGKEGWGEQGPAQGPSWASWWAFPAQPKHPSLARDCWLSFSAVKPLLLARSDMVISPVPLCLSQEVQQMREAMSAKPRMSDWALKSAGTDRPQVPAGRARRAGLVLGVPKRRLRCRLGSPTRREMGRNHGAQEHDCGRAAPLGSPQSCLWDPRWSPSQAPDSISALSHSMELRWGTKASGQVVLCCPNSRASNWVCSPSCGGLLSPISHSCSPLPSGAAIDLLKSSSSSAWLCRVFSFLCAPPVLDTFVQVQ